MSKKSPTVWDAPPHTIAKIALLRRYLNVWFLILGRPGLTQGGDMWFIDGFAGPGEYTNDRDGSPIAALQAADAALATAGARMSGSIHCAFFEEDRKRFEHLKDRLAQHPEHLRVKRYLFNGTFEAGMSWLRAQTDNPFRQACPLFVFVDPFGTSGLPYGLLKTVLERQRAEVLVNLDSDGVGRVRAAKEDGNHVVQLDALFGDRSWESRLESSRGMSQLIKDAVQLYRERLGAIPGVDYTFPFEMRARSTLANYHLIFATRHRLGLEKMKEAMKTIDQSGAYTFCDTHVGQHQMFTSNDPAHYANSLHLNFKGKTVTYADVDRYALNDSPFLNPKQMLRALEAQNLIAVESKDATRKKGTFPEDKIRLITFI